MSGLCNHDLEPVLVKHIGGALEAERPDLALQMLVPILKGGCFYSTWDEFLIKNLDLLDLKNTRDWTEFQEDLEDLRRGMDTCKEYCHQGKGLDQVEELLQQIEIWGYQQSALLARDCRHKVGSGQWDT